MVCSTMIGNGSASTRTATLAISITPPGMAARNAVLASVAVIRISMSAPNPATTMEMAAPTTMSGSSSKRWPTTAGVNDDPMAAPVTNCPAARACHNERTGTAGQAKRRCDQQRTGHIGQREVKQFGHDAAGETDREGCQ